MRASRGRELKPTVELILKDIEEQMKKGQNTFDVNWSEELLRHVNSALYVSGWTVVVQKGRRPDQAHGQTYAVEIREVSSWQPCRD
jgi:hypothetical protein